MISITLPSIHPEALGRTLANLRQTTLGQYEVIVVSPFAPPEGYGAVWIPESNPQGPNVAHGLAFDYASGEYVLGWVDDHLLTFGWDKHAVHLLKTAEGIMSLAMLGLRHSAEGHVGTVFGHYYPYFPFARRSALRDIGWLGVGKYQRGFADCDLGLRIWDAGGFCTWGHRCVQRCADDVKVLVDGEAGYEPNDLRTFLQRWLSTYGKGWSTNLIRDFNVDVVPEQLPALKHGTIQFSTPREMWG